MHKLIRNRKEEIVYNASIISFWVGRIRDPKSSPDTRLHAFKTISLCSALITELSKVEE